MKSDRLIALTGIIQELTHCTGWRNTCGLGEPFMLDELAWQTYLGDPRPRVTGAPTWSWGSVDSDVCNLVVDDPRAFLANFEDRAKHPEHRKYKKPGSSHPYRFVHLKPPL